MKRGTAVVVGGGVSGLTLSFKLLKNQKFNRVVLLEKKNKIGGWLETKQFSGIGLFEQGPRSVRVSGGEETLKLLKEIELNPLLPTLQSKARFILTPNRSGDSSEIRELFPSSKLEFFSKSPMAPLLPDIIKNQVPKKSANLFFSDHFFKIIFFYKFLVRNKQFTGRETIYEFFSAQFGERLARTIGAAAIGGIYAGDIEKLSTRDCFPIFFDTMEAGKSSSLLLASLKKAFSGKKTNETKMDEKIKSAGAYSFTKGMQQLPNEIRSVLETNFSDQFHLMQNQTILQIEKNEKSNVSTAYLSDSSKIEFDHLFFTTPSFETGTILRNFTGNEHNENISRTIQLLESIHYADIAVINMAWNSSLNTPQGFGYLVSPTTCASILGVTFDRFFPLFFPSMLYPS